jgi:hypothetical protein
MTTSGPDGNFKALAAGEYEMEVLRRGFEQSITVWHHLSLKPAFFPTPVRLP